MPQSAPDTGRPRKYASEEEKARRDVIARRDRRRPQSGAVRRDAEFQTYPPLPTRVGPSRPSSASQIPMRSLERLNTLAEIASMAHPIVTILYGSTDPISCVTTTTTTTPSAESSRPRPTEYRWPDIDRLTRRIAAAVVTKAAEPWIPVPR